MRTYITERGFPTMKKTLKSILCLVLVAALVASLAGCAKLNYVTNGTIQAIKEVKSGDWKKTDENADSGEEEDKSVLDSSFKAGTYGGVEFKTLDDVANYYVQAYNYTKTLTADYIDNGEKKTYYKLIGSEDLNVGNILIDGKENAAIKKLVPGIVGGMFAPNAYGLVPSTNRDPKLDNNLDDKTRKNDHDFRTSALKGENLLDANIVDNGDGTITMTLQPKEEESAFRGEGNQGSFFMALGDITGTVATISILKFEQGDANDNVKVLYKGGTGKVKINTKTKEIVEADYTMIAQVSVTHATITVVKDKSANVTITYTNHFPAKDDWLKEKKNITRA